MCEPHLWMPKRSEEGIASPVAEDRGGYDPPDEGAGICYRVPWKNSVNS